MENICNKNTIDLYYEQCDILYLPVKSLNFQTKKNVVTKRNVKYFHNCDIVSKLMSRNVSL